MWKNILRFNRIHNRCLCYAPTFHLADDSSNKCNQYSCDDLAHVRIEPKDLFIAGNVNTHLGFKYQKPHEGKQRRKKMLPLCATMCGQSGGLSKSCPLAWWRSAWALCRERGWPLGHMLTVATVERVTNAVTWRLERKYFTHQHIGNDLWSTGSATVCWLAARCIYLVGNTADWLMNESRTRRVHA